MLLGLHDQAGLHWIVLNICHDAIPLTRIADSVVVRFPLPEWLASSSQQAIRLSSGITLERLQ